MGDKRDKRRPGRESARCGKVVPDVFEVNGVRVQLDVESATVTLVSGGYVAMIDLVSGYVHRNTPGEEMTTAERNRVTAVALDVLAQRGRAPADPCDLFEDLFR